MVPASPYIHLGRGPDKSPSLEQGAHQGDSGGTGTAAEQDETPRRRQDEGHICSEYVLVLHIWYLKPYMLFFRYICYIKASVFSVYVSPVGTNGVEALELRLNKMRPHDVDKMKVPYTFHIPSRCANNLKRLKTSFPKSGFSVGDSHLLTPPRKVPFGIYGLGHIASRLDMCPLNMHHHRRKP